MAGKLSAVPQAREARWFRINVAEEESRADVYLYDVIDSWFGVSAENFVREVSALAVDVIDLWVNSPGGYVDDGVAMLNALRRHKARVVAHVDGLAASAASFIIQGADEVLMGRNSELMIHDAASFCWGNADEMERAREFLERTSENIASIYAAKAGGSAADWRAAMKAETWYSAEEAVKAGLADRVDEERDASEVKNHLDFRAFNHAGRSDAPAPFMPARGRAAIELPAGPGEKQEEGMSAEFVQNVRERLGVPAEAELDEAGVLAALDEALAEVPEDGDGAAGGEPAAGTVLIDEQVLEGLRADAAAGRAARDKQEADGRVAVVDQAVREGRIAPARRDHWIKALEADPGAVDVLNALAVGTVPLEAKGHTGGVDEASDEDRLYNQLYKKEASNG